MRRYLLLMAALVSGCASAPGTPPWGADGMFWPGAARIRQAALSAATTPAVWMPAAGAVLVYGADLDDDLSDWAREQTPLFGSQRGARQASDTLRDATHVALIGSALAAPSGEDLGAILPAKLRGLIVEGAAVLATEELVHELKASSDRPRPNGQDRRSFPSGHASAAHVAAGLTRENLRYFDLDPGAARHAGHALSAVAAGSAWARVEGGMHYPSDVLVGAAIGNFMARFFSEALLHPAAANDHLVFFALRPDGIVVGFGLGF